MRAPPEVIATCFEIIIKELNNWPEDDWYMPSPDWDLNLTYEAYRNKYVATLYHVKDGQTQTNVSLNIAKFTAPKGAKNVRK